MCHSAVNLMTLVPRSAASRRHVFDGAPEKQAVAGGVDPGLWGSQRSPHPAEHGLYSLCVVAAFLGKPAYIKREREKLGFLRNYYYFFNVYFFIFFFNFFSKFIYFWDRERQSMNGGGAEREGDTESETGSRL